jgi:hypothetical protein
MLACASRTSARSRTAGGRRPSPSRSRRPRPPRREDDVARAELGEVVRDEAPIAPAPATTIRATRPARASRRPSSVRSGARTSSRTGTPRLPRTYFAAAWKGKRSSPERSSPTPSSATTRSGKPRPAPRRCPPHPRPAEVLGADEHVEALRAGTAARRRADGRDLHPARFGARSRRRSTRLTGTAYPLRALNS